MNKLIEKIKNDVLKSSVVIAAFVLFVTGIVVTAMNTGDTYAASVTPDITVTATFNANGGSVSPTSRSCIYNVGEGESGCTISLPTPTRSGYTFNGWNGSLKGSTTISSDTSFTAYWTANSAATPDITVKATFNPNGGSVSPTSKSCSYNVGDGESSCSVSLPTPTRDGFVFRGWSTSGGASCSGITGSATISSDTTYIACWVKAVTPDITVKATFDANGGTVSPTSTTCSYNVGDGESNCSVTLPTPTRSGYTFDGWRASTGGLIKGSTTIESDTTFTAYWTPNSAATPDITVKATFDANGGTVSPTSKTCNYNVGDGESNCSITLPTPTRSGYTFNGWRSSSGGGLVTGSVTLSGDATFTAYWTSNSAATPDITVKATFNPNGGSVSPASTTCNYNVGDGELECSVSLPTPTRSGYTFNGWCKGSSSCSSPIKGSTKIESDTTFYATWSLVDSGGSSNPSNPSNPDDGDDNPTNPSNPSNPDGGDDNPTNPDNPSNPDDGDDNPTNPDNPSNPDDGDDNSTNPDNPSNPDDGNDDNKTDDEIDENEKTGDILIVMVWIIGLSALGYSVYYFMKQRNTI